MADYVALKAEIAKLAYAGLGDQETADAVMAATLSPDRMVPSVEVGRLWARQGVLAAAREAGNRGANAAARQLGWRVLDIVEKDVLGELDTRNAGDRAAFEALLDLMVASTAPQIMTAAQRTATVALIAKARSGREVFGVLTAVDIVNARAS